MNNALNSVDLKKPWGDKEQKSLKSFIFVELETSVEQDSKIEEFGANAGHMSHNRTKAEHIPNYINKTLEVVF